VDILVKFQWYPPDVRELKEERISKGVEGIENPEADMEERTNNLFKVTKSALHPYPQERMQRRLRFVRQKLTGAQEDDWEDVN